MKEFDPSEMEDERDSRNESLLDLPLRGTPEPTLDHEAADDPEPSPPTRPSLLDSPVEVEISRPQAVPAAAPVDSDSEPAAAGPGRTAPLIRRLKGALFDVAVHLTIIALLAVGAWLLGVRLSGVTGGALVMLLLFSFLYTIPALLVWRRTPGAAVAGLEVRNADGSTPTGSQALRRWIAQWVTWLLAGLPGLFRLADRWSGTETVVR